MREVLVCSYPLTVLSEIVRAQGTLSRKTVTRDHGKTLKWITFSAMFVAARKPARPPGLAPQSSIQCCWQLRLTDLRWQYGPFPKEFAKTIYYDPRESGSVLATTNDDINLVLRPSRGSSAH